MPVPQELANWVEEMRKAGLSQETLQALDKDLDRKEVADSFKRTVLAVADYSRQTQELAKQRQEIGTYMAQLQQWKKDRELDLRKNNEETLHYKQLAQEAQAEKQRIVAAQEELVRQGILDPSLLMTSTPPAAVTQKTPPASTPLPGNGERYLTMEDLKKFKEQTDSEYLGVMALQSQILREHHKLFGDFPDMDELIRIRLLEA